MLRIQRTWEQYQQLGRLEAGSAEQLTAMREAFFTGASAIFYSMLNNMSDADQPTDDDMRFMAELQMEIDTFGQALDFEVLARTMRGMQRSKP